MVINTEKLTYKTHRNIPRIVYLFFLIVMLMAIPLISADWIFNNVKNDLVIDKGTSNYGKIEIDDWYGLKKLMSLELLENSEQCSAEGCSAKQEIIMYEDGKLIDDVRFIDLETGKQTNIKNYEIYVNGDLYNGEEVSGYSNGVKYNVELRGDLFILQSVDWQVKSAGTDWITEWATWASSLTNGTMAYWKFEEGSGTNVEDWTGNYDLTTNASWVSGIIDNAVNYDLSGLRSYNDTFMDKNMTDFSVSLWFKPNATYSDALTTFQYLLTKPDTHGVNHFYINLDANDGKLHVSLEGEDAGGKDLKTNQTSWTKDRWYHVVTVWDARNNISLYIDGEHNHTVAYTATLNTSTLLHDFNLGGSFRTATYDFNGTIDEVGVWDRALTVVEITNLYNSGSGVTPIRAITTTLNSPIDHYNTTNKDITFNCSAETGLADGNITNISLYHNASGSFVLNQTNATLRLHNSTSTFTASFDISSYTWNCLACDDSAACAFGTNRTFDIKSLTVDAENYSQITTEGNVETFYVNITTSSLDIDSGNLTYNNTNYAAEFTQSGNEFYISKTINIPQVTSSKNLTFNWNFELSDSSTYSTSSHNQSVLSLNIDNCSTYNYTLFNITLRDEEDQSKLTGGTQNTSIKLEFTISTSDNIVMTNYSTFFNLTNPAAVCLENSLNQSTLRLDGIIEYSSLERFTEFYHFQNYSLDESATHINISLYNLNSSDGQEFKITYKDSNFVPIEGAILDIQRKYVDEGVFKTTERPKTGTEGYTMGHLVINDVIYNIIVYKEGVILASFNDIVADCQNPALSSCTINLNSYGSSVLPESFATANDISFTLTYNKTTREIDSIFTILSGATSSINLDVNLFDSLGETSVCNDTLYASGGAVSCIVPLSFGNSTVIAKLNKNGDLIGQSVIRITPDPSDIYGNNLIYIALIAFVTLIGIGISDNPMMMGIMLMVGVFVLVGLNLIYTPAIVGVGATILWFIVAVAIILIKGSNRQ